MTTETMHGAAVHEPADIGPVIKKLTPGQATRLGYAYIVMGVLLIAAVLFGWPK